MTIQQITNPSAKLKQVTDFRTGLTASGELIAEGGIYLPFRANAAIGKGALVAFVVPTATVPLSVKERVNADLFTMTAGVAMNAAVAAGDQVTVCVYGASLAQVGAGTPVIGDYGLHSATTAIVAPANTQPDATTINSNLLGVFLGVKDANNLCSFWVNIR